MTRLLALLLLGVLLERWRLFAVLATPFDAGALLLIVTLLWIGLLLASVAGLLGARPWGAAALLALVPVSTVLHGVPLVPGLSRLLPAAARPTAVLVLNVLVALAALLVLRLLRRPRDAAA